MPLEISEIGVHLVVGPATSATSTNSSSGHASQSAALTQQDIDNIVQETTRRVLAQLKAEESR